MQVCQDIIEQTCFIESSLVMRHGFLSMIQKPSARAVIGQCRRKQESKSEVKVMLITFFNVRGIIHSEFLPQGQTINLQVYKEILQLLLRSVREKRRELWQDKSRLLHHDRAPAHNALSIRQFLAEKNIAILEKPPYSPDLALCDLFYFPQAHGDYQGDQF